MNVRAILTVQRESRSIGSWQVRALIQHAMETGYRRSSDGDLLPRSLIRRFECDFLAAGGEPVRVFAASLHAAIAANPALSFSFTPPATGQIRCTWRGDDGFAHVAIQNLA